MLPLLAQPGPLFVIPAKAWPRMKIRNSIESWIPACAGMTALSVRNGLREG